eukprot:748382-Hanusia_phi.AAC.9
MGRLRWEPRVEAGDEGKVTWEAERREGKDVDEEVQSCQVRRCCSISFREKLKLVQKAMSTPSYDGSDGE